MKKTKIISLLLCICLVLPAFASCDNGTQEFTRDTSEASDNDDPGFLSADYDGDEFTIFTLTSSTSTNEYYCGAWIDSDSLTGTATDDAVYKRNKACEEKYNINITEKKSTGSGDMEELKQYYMTGDYCFDVIYSWGLRLGSVVTDGLFYDFRELDDAGYIDLDADYWCPSTLDDLTIAGRNFIAVNDITMSKLSWSCAIFYNPQIVEDFGLEDPQQLVADNNWTLDKFIELTRSVHAEMDNDGSFTKEDKYGFIYSGDITCMLYGAGVTETTKEDDGSYTLAIGETKCLDLISKLKDIINDKSYVFYSTTINEGADMTGYDQWEYFRSYFSKGHSLFLVGSPELTREFKDMEDGYGVVPMPKYDSNQTEYYSKIDPCAGMFAIPNTCRMDVSSASLERTGTIMEYLAYKSGAEGGVVDAYYETTIKGQRMTIEGNKDMLDIVRNSGHYEWSELLGLDITTVLGSMFESNGASSRYQQSKTRLIKSIDDMYDKLLALD